MIDPYTNEEFQARRSNQIFRCASNRINFHNSKAKKIRHNKSSIDRKLHRNYCIIIELIKDNEIINCSKDFLLGKGFDFGVLTHFNEYNNNRYPSIYDFMFYEKDNEVYFQKIIE